MNLPTDENSMMPMEPSPPKRRWRIGRWEVSPRMAAVTAGLLVLVGVPLLMLSCAGGGGTVNFDKVITFAGPPTVRVALAVRTRNIVVDEIRVNGFYSIIDPETGRRIARGSNLTRSPVAALNGGIVLTVGSRQLRFPRIRIVPDDDGKLYVHNCNYRGALDVVYNSDDGTMTLINVVDLESYLRGVLPAEMPARWPDAALRAQAVAARTWTLANIMENDRKKPRPPYDFVSGFRSSQEYRGVAGEHPNATEAVNATRGMVLLYKNLVFRAYYHSASGGHTEACGEVWPDYQTIPPLAGVEDDYSRRSPHQDWTFKATRGQIENALRARGCDVGTLTGLRFTDVNNDGHNDRVLITGSRGSRRMIAGDFRLALIDAKLPIKSTNFTVTRSGDTFEFTGHGFGHGVGMSQYGAMNMAVGLRSYDEILKFYYPGAKLAMVYE